MVIWTKVKREEWLDSKLTRIDDRLDTGAKGKEGVKSDSWFLACTTREVVGSLDEKLEEQHFGGDIA